MSQQLQHKHYSCHSIGLLQANFIIVLKFHTLLSRHKIRHVGTNDRDEVPKVSIIGEG